MKLSWRWVSIAWKFGQSSESFEASGQLLLPREEMKQPFTRARRGAASSPTQPPTARARQKAPFEEEETPYAPQAVCRELEKASTT